MMAMNLEMPPRVPRTEFSAEMHWRLIKTVTDIDVNAFSEESVKKTAAIAFINAWNYDFIWSAPITHPELGEYITNMGHAVYADSGTDFDNHITKLFDDPEDVYEFDFYEKLGTRDKNELVKRFDEYYDTNVSTYHNAVNMTGIYITCISGLIALLGWDMLLLSLGLDKKRFGEFTNRYVKWIEQYYIALAESKAPVVMLHDDITWTSGAFIRPEWYREFVFPNYTILFDHLRQAGKKILFTSDGNYTEFIDDIISCGVNGLVLEPTTDMNYIAEKYGKTHIFVGNADTRILLGGSRDDIYNEVKRCMDIGKNCPGFFMAVGNHIPPNTPVENALYYNEVYEELSRR